MSDPAKAEGLLREATVLISRAAAALQGEAPQVPEYYAANRCWHAVMTLADVLGRMPTVKAAKRRPEAR